LGKICGRVVRAGEIMSWAWKKDKIADRRHSRPSVPEVAVSGV